MIRFQWTTEADRHATNGKRFVLRSPALPKGAMSPLCSDDRLAVCTHEGGQKWEACFWIGYESLKFIAGTPAKAMRLLEAELDKRSLGLFGVDDVAFEAAA